LTYKWHGKTVAKTLPIPAAVRKAEREIAEFREYLFGLRDGQAANDQPYVPRLPGTVSRRASPVTAR
jgi:hypothetical protein